MDRIFAALFCLCCCAEAGEMYFDLAPPTRASSGWGSARSDASVDGKPLRIGSVAFAQGIGTHAPAEVVRPLAAKYHWLTFYTGVSADLTGEAIGAPGNEHVGILPIRQCRCGDDRPRRK